MISHELKCIFIHINRNGGKSIEQAMFGVEPAKGSSDHKRIRWWQKNIDEDTFDQYFKFCFCRNPWDRLVSLYSYYLQILDYQTSRRPKKGIPGMLESFEKFVRLSNPENPSSPVPSQLQWIMDENEIPNVNFIGRFENFTEDWNKVCKIVGINKPLPHLNKSAHNRYQTYYNDELIQIVEEKYKEDVEFFGYEFWKDKK